MTPVRVPPDALASETAEAALGHTLAVIDRALQDSEFLAGGTFSLADASLMPYVASLPVIGAEHLLAGLRGLDAWWARMRDRASWQAALTASWSPAANAPSR